LTGPKEQEIGGLSGVEISSEPKMSKYPKAELPASVPVVSFDRAGRVNPVICVLEYNETAYFLKHKAEAHNMSHSQES